MSMMRWLGAMMAGAVTALLAMVLAVATVRAQDAAAATAAKPATMAANADPDWEVVSVKPSDPDDKYDFFNIKGRHVVIRNESVMDILRTAYGMQKSQFVGLPDWVKTERYNVDGVADAAGTPDADQMHALMRKLLAERFGLKTHREQRQMDVYALTVAKGGPRMEPSKSAPEAMPGNAGGQDNGRQTRKYWNVSMADLAPMLQFNLDRPVVDQTGIKGRYDFTMKWTVDQERATEPDAPPVLFTAIQEQIGLKLEATKAPADVLVVDAIQRPAAN
jgi:uncharacterized protein (TIGR03435 family)